MKALTAALLVSVASSGASLFDETSTLELRLEGPLSSVVEHKGDKQQYPFTLDHAGKIYSVKVRSRGKSRLRVCAFPPLRLNFRKEDDFDGADKLKLVTHCRDSKQSQIDVVEEYAVYRMFSLLTDNSLRVRLARMTYVDTQGTDFSRYAFFLEPEHAMAERIGTGLSDLGALSLSWMDQDQAALVYVFAYMIGNTDWSLVTADGDTVCCHNEIIVEQDPGKLLLVPYDFDLTGFVDAKYAKPDASLRTSSVKQRRYRGYCTDRGTLRRALDMVIAHENAFMGVVDSLPVLTQKDKAKKKRYLAGFFKQAKKPERLVNRFDSRCLGASR